MTSIDWLIEEIESFGIDTKFISESITQAKEMHKQELFEYWQGGINCTGKGGESFDQYYQESFASHSSSNNCDTELPQKTISYQEIFDTAKEYSKSYSLKFVPRSAFIDGAVWYKEQLKQKK
jgi:hypothetical protein